MIKLKRNQFLIQCAQAKKSLTDTLSCIIDMEGDIWTADETHESYPTINFGDENSNSNIMLCGSMKSVDKIQESFLLNKFGSNSEQYKSFIENNATDSNPLP
jgi:hypothetical protein